MPKVTFKCTMSDDVAVVQMAIQSADDKGQVVTVQFESSGQHSRDISNGTHTLHYKGLGAEGGTLAVEALTGGSLSTAINRTLPGDGVASGIRELQVP